LAQIILILQRIKPLENFAQHFNIVTWWSHQKCRLQAETDI